MKRPLWDAFIGSAFCGKRAVPPEVIVPNESRDLPLSLIENHRRDFRFFPTFMNKAVHSHHPPEEQTVLFDSLKAVGRTRGEARAAVPINGRNVISVRLMNQRAGWRFPVSSGGRDGSAGALP